MHACMYNAWRTYDAVAQPTPSSVGVNQAAADRTPTNIATAMSHAAYVALVDLYPGQKVTFVTCMTTLGLRSGSGLCGLAGRTGRRTGSR